MDEIAFHTLLIVAIAGWLRIVVNPPSQSTIDSVQPLPTCRRDAMVFLVIAISVMASCVIGLIGMFVYPLFFRWVFLLGISGMLVGKLFLPVPNQIKSRKANFLEHLQHLIDGAILAFAFFVFES